MEGMTTEDKLLGQDDIDALLGEAGIEGSYEAKGSQEKPHNDPYGKTSYLKREKRSDDDARFTISFLRNKAFLVRENDVKVIWNASGTISMATGFNITIQDREYISLGILHENHLVVKDLGGEG
jgi:hypothetical protein